MNNFDDKIAVFLKELYDFVYDLDYKDHKWNLIFPYANNKWFYLHITRYNETFYFIHIDGDYFDRGFPGFEVEPGKSIKASNPFGDRTMDYDVEFLSKIWEPVINAAGQWMKTVKRNWIKANKQVVEQYPLNRRYGIVPNSLIISSLPDVFRIDKELGKVRTQKLIKLLEKRAFDQNENTKIPNMTAAKFFEYCKIGYLASKSRREKIDPSLPGRELYKRYADGRHDGLLDIDETSEKEFADWLDGKHPKRGMGGHPWEIKRGGNTTHIDLFVRRPRFDENNFQVVLRGESFVRLAETLKMLLAIYKAGLPIAIEDPDGIRKRLLALDNIGIVPGYASLHRANQHFRKEDDVYDVMYYDDLGRYKRRITPFITWEPLPLFRPRNI